MRRGEANMKVVLRTNERSQCRPSKGWRLITTGVVKSVGSGKLLGSHRLLSGHLRPPSCQQQVQQSISHHFWMLSFGVKNTKFATYIFFFLVLLFLAFNLFINARVFKLMKTCPIHCNVGELEIRRGILQLQLGCQCH